MTESDSPVVVPAAPSPSRRGRPRYGLIGTAYWAGQVHARAASTSDDVEFVAVLGRDPARTEAFAADWQVAAHLSLSSFLSQVDVVGLAVPPSTQPELAVAAARAGRDLILEKPLSLSRPAAETLARQVTAAGVRSVIFLTQRFLPDVEAWIADCRRWGSWTYASAEGFSPLLLDPQNPYHCSTWRHTEGALWDAAAHPLSLLCPILGRVRAVSATRGRSDLTVLTLVHDSGAVSTLALSHGMHPAAAGSRMVLSGPGGSTEAPAITEWNQRAVEAYRLALATVLGARDQVTGESELSTDVHFGAHLTAVLAAAEEAMAKHREIEIAMP
ncbi:MAG: Gfo/Idh/MocA family oxidoreductase [Propionicimonas sp.]|uniref:Gfo/Idh/MocA family protein n=1 Tax=Propionicimonas sp. TaxID=1955623 RepID=UPI002B212973|nr:Gfo/Idh/MocA family oxidoreductase [Propionicimonas sp.]MEA4944964.1 Gfo/Idh/MocA family oxidoreductase [Propionicimonas sp.]